MQYAPDEKALFVCLRLQPNSFEPGEDHYVFFQSNIEFSNLLG